MEKWRLEHPHDTPPYRFTPSPLLSISTPINARQAQQGRAQEDAENRRRRERQEQTRFDTQTLALGLFGEITAIKSKCEIYKSVLRSLRDDWQPDSPEWDKHAHDAITISSHPEVSATMYQSNANRLGLLGIPTVQHVSELYSRLIPHEKSATAPDDKIFVRHFVGVVNQWIENLGHTLEYIDTVLAELAVIGATGDPNTLEQLTRIVHFCNQRCFSSTPAPSVHHLFS